MEQTKKIPSKLGYVWGKTLKFRSKKANKPKFDSFDERDSTDRRSINRFSNFGGGLHL